MGYSAGSLDMSFLYKYVVNLGKGTPFFKSEVPLPSRGYSLRKLKVCSFYPPLFISAPCQGYLKLAEATQTTCRKKLKQGCEVTWDRTWDLSYRRQHTNQLCNPYSSYRNFRAITRVVDYPHQSFFCNNKKKISTDYPH